MSDYFNSCFLRSAVSDESSIPSEVCLVSKCANYHDMATPNITF